MTCKFVVKYHFCAMAHKPLLWKTRRTGEKCFMLDVIFDNNISQDIFMALSHNGPAELLFVDIDRKL